MFPSTIKLTEYATPLCDKYHVRIDVTCHKSVQPCDSSLVRVMNLQTYCIRAPPKAGREISRGWISES